MHTNKNYLVRCLCFTIILFFSSNVHAQIIYWTESFESTNIPGNSSSYLSTPTNVDLSATSGVWNMYYVYRGSTTCTSGKPLRLMKNTSAGISGSSFAISPFLNHGVSKLSFIETNGGITKVVGVYKSTDNGATWSLVQSVSITANLCDTLKVTINDTLVNKLKFTNESGSDVNMDLLKVYKYGDSSIIVPPPPASDSLPYYPYDSSRLKAFPGADGAGAYTTGGRGGVVYHVTNLLDDAAGTTLGSFRWAEKHNTGPKTIVFDVSGTIHLAAPLSLTRGNLTIAGQTAPGDGICFADMPITLGKTNVIVRFIRFRLGDIALQRNPQPYPSSSADCVNSSGGANADSMIIDHCSTSWSDDEACSFKNMKHFTLQNCMITEPLNQSQHSGELHGYGGIWGGVNATFHHNLFAHCSSRSPRFNGSRQYTDGTLDTVDFRNNVIYNWGINTVYGGEGGYYNIVNNYYKQGPSTGSNSFYRTLNPYSGSGYGFGKYYMTGNFMNGNPTITNDNWLGCVMEGATLADTVQSKVTNQIKTYRVAFTSADSALQSVLQNAGAILPKRDTVDQRIIRDVMNGTGRIIDVQGGYPPNTDSTISYTAWPNLQSLPAPSDFDQDGMPSEWEWQRGLDSTNAIDRNNISPIRYTNLEVYMNGDTITAQGSLNNCVNAKPVFSSNTNKWIDLKDTTYTRLISTDTMNVVASIKDDGNYGTFTSSYYTTNSLRYFNNKPYLSRNITITPANPGAIVSPVTVRIYFTKAEYDVLKLIDNTITGLADLRIIKVTDNACITSLPNAGTVITPTAYGIYGTYQRGYYLEFTTSSFSTFFITGATAAPLPVELLSFNAGYEGSKVKVNWKTTNEINTKNFILQRSADGNIFSTITSIDAVNSVTGNSYSYDDVNPLSGISYYRLKIFDKDAKFKYSPVIAVKQKVNKLVEVYPNPASNTITVFHEKVSGESSIKIISTDGKELLNQNIIPGVDFNTINISQLPKGVYLLKYQNEKIITTQKIIKQ